MNLGELAWQSRIRKILRMPWTKDSRIDWLRNRANELRLTAHKMQHAESRAALLLLAENYEKFATERETKKSRGRNI